MKRERNETIYADGHAVAFMALLARAGGTITLSRDELALANGTILRAANLDGTITYRLRTD